jgi:Mg-chelatase subunit ChlD
VRRRLAALACLLLAAPGAAACRGDAPAGDDRRSRTERRLDEQLAPAAEVPIKDGLAAAIVIDVSGSMDDGVEGEGGGVEPKIDIARRAARDLVEQFAKYADDHKDEPVLLGLYEFSQRSGEPDCRPIMAMGVPDRGRADAAIAAMHTGGGTPIGNAMIAAKRELDSTGLARRHLLVVTDGQNTDGASPEAVAAAIGRRPETERPSVYFIAFDIEASRFNGVRDRGGLVLAAANARELNATLDTLLRGSILVEK